MAVVSAVAVVIGGVATAPPTLAQTPNTAIYGDLDGDGFEDRVFLGAVPPTMCSIVVQYGRPENIYLPPVAYTYFHAGAELRCPDIGAALDLDVGSPDDEMVVAWSGGPPPSVDHNLMVLENFRPAFETVAAVSQPTYMGTADLNDDGRVDLYLATDKGQGFESYFSLGDSRLTPSPVRWCSGPLDFQLKDFDRDGEIGVLIAYSRGCSDDSNGVVAIRSSGAPQQLQRDPAGVETWSARVAYVNSDRNADVRTESRLTGKVDHFIGVGDGTVIQAPQANGDRVTVPDGKKTAFDVLGNDYATRLAKVTITDPPRYGTARVGSDRRVHYTPRTPRGRTDRFEYTITDDGRRSTTSVYVQFAE